MSIWLLILCGISVVACGLVSGVFLTFSDFVMKSLAAATPAGGIEAMQIINRRVYGSLFLVLLLGMSALSPFLIVYALLDLAAPASIWIIAGGATYLAGVFLVTLVFNVPMNKRLNAMDHATADTVSYWRRYVPAWTLWNHIRASAAAASAVFYLLACVWLARAMATAG